MTRSASVGASKSTSPPTGSAQARAVPRGSCGETRKGRAGARKVFGWLRRGEPFAGIAGGCN